MHSQDQQNFETAERLVYLAQNDKTLSKLGQFRRSEKARPTSISFVLKPDVIPDVAQSFFAKFLESEFLLKDGGLAKITMNGKPIEKVMPVGNGLVGDIVQSVRHRTTTIEVPFEALDADVLETITPDCITPTDLGKIHRRIKGDMRREGR